MRFKILLKDTRSEVTYGLPQSVVLRLLDAAQGSPLSRITHALHLAIRDNQC